MSICWGLWESERASTASVTSPSNILTPATEKNPHEKWIPSNFTTIAYKNCIFPISHQNMRTWSVFIFHQVSKSIVYCYCCYYYHCLVRSDKYLFCACSSPALLIHISNCTKIFRSHVMKKVLNPLAKEKRLHTVPTNAIRQTPPAKHVQRHIIYIYLYIRSTVAAVTS